MVLFAGLRGNEELAEPFSWFSVPSSETGGKRPGITSPVAACQLGRRVGEERGVTVIRRDKEATVFSASCKRCKAFPSADLYGCEPLVGRKKKKGNGMFAK